MTWANVSELQLEQENLIPTNLGQTLSWQYWLYAKEHPMLATIVFPTPYLLEPV